MVRAFVNALAAGVGVELEVELEEVDVWLDGGVGVVRGFAIGLATGTAGLEDILSPLLSCEEELLELELDGLKLCGIGAVNLEILGIGEIDVDEEAAGAGIGSFLNVNPGFSLAACANLYNSPCRYSNVSECFFEMSLTIFAN